MGKKTITVRADVKELRAIWKERNKSLLILKVLALCGFDDAFINDISDFEWARYKRLIGLEVKTGPGGYGIR